ncbi:MAG: heparin lyase I family protein [Cyclobacteriaceae bacterium]|nr:heparin lyase I family protein [Cyclobacteriaceae bacterium HetDA_MAG_MS6]
MNKLCNLRLFFSMMLLSLVAWSTRAQINSYCGGNPPTTLDVRNESSSIVSVSSPSYQGGTSIRFQTNTNSSTTQGWSVGHDRCEAAINNCPTTDMFSNMRYAGFMVYLDSNVDGTKADESYEIITQWRQCSGPASPPITIHLEENGSGVDFLLAIRTDADPVEGRHNTASFTKKVSVQRNRWYQVTIGALVKPTGGGVVKWWIDGNLEVDYAGKVGRTDLAQSMGLKIGIYRGPTFPTAKGAETVYFDQVGYGTSYNDVQPGHCVASAFPDLTKWYFIESVAYPGERIKAQSSTTDLRRQNGSTDSRQWKFVNAGSGYYYLESKSYPGERIKAQSSTVNLRRQSGNTDSRQWKLVDAGGGSYYIESKQYAGERIKAQSSTTTLRRQAGSTDSRKWKFVEAGSVARLAPEGFDQMEVVQEASNELRIFPNPVNDRFTISFSANEDQQIRYHLFDMMGRQVRSLEKQVSEGNQLEVVDVSGMLKGIYVLDLWIDGSRLTKRISIN